MKQTAVILGAGQMGRAASTLLNANHLTLLAFGDNSPAVWDRTAQPPVLPVTEAIGLHPDCILLGVADSTRAAQLEAQACAAGFSGPVLSLPQLRGGFDLRAAVLRRLAARLQNVPGHLAELGVFRGDFAWQLNDLFPDRPLHLFDTFTGFDARDTALEPAPRAHAPDFADTSAEFVLARMPHPEQIRLHPGYFPDSLGALDARFALVSLDPDLYAPTLSGLRWFYPRMSPGGVLLIHDYHNRQFPGVRKAVCEYEAEQGPLLLLPLPDLHGTAAVIHP